MLKVQEFLLKYPTRNAALDALKSTYNIGITEYIDDLIVLNYNQIDSPRFNALVDECRGLILSWDFKTVYCRPFTRFYNYKEGQQNQQFDFSKSKIFEKLDGSLMPMWYHPVKNIWNVSTRKMAYAEGKTVFGSSYRQLFMKCLGLDSNINDFEFTTFINSMLDIEHRKYTFIFEMTSPETRIVKKYSEYTNYLLGIRKNDTNDNEVTYKDIIKSVHLFNSCIKLPKVYSFSNELDVTKSFKELGSMDEGYVCFNEENEIRVKVKTPTYVAIHNMRSNGQINPKKIVVLIFENEYEEYLVYFPEDRIFFEPYIKAYTEMVKEINEYFNIYGDIQNQKKFALAINTLPFSSILFSMKEGRRFTDICSSLTDERKLNLLEMFIDNKWKTMMKNDNTKNKRK